MRKMSKRPVFAAVVIGVALVGVILRVLGEALGDTLLLILLIGLACYMALQMGQQRAAAASDRAQARKHRASDIQFQSSMRWFSTEILNHQGSIWRRVRQWEQVGQGAPKQAVNTVAAATIPTRGDKQPPTPVAKTVVGATPAAAKPSDEAPVVAAAEMKAQQENAAEWLIDHELVLREAMRLPESRYFRAPSARPLKDIRVAMIADEFTYNSFSREFSTIAMHPSTAHEQLEEFNPDLLFVESAWKGMPDKSAPWRAQIYSSAKFNYENRTKLLALVGQAKRRGIPTVFWNKEDPTHFHDRVTDFVSTASFFDYIFTTAEECIPEYEKFHDPTRLGCLQFAASPSLFNPLNAPETRAEKVIFAGSWYAVHPKRSEEMAAMFQQLIERGLDLEMYDRYFQTDNPLFQVPERFKALTRPAVAHDETANLYRSAKFVLNINTVTDSDTMFARRVFEAAATGAHVISNDSIGMRRLFGADVTWADELDDPEALDEASTRALRMMNKVLEQHTYAARAEQILDLVGIPYTSHRASTTLVALVSTEAECEAAIAAAQRLGPLVDRLLLVVADTVPSHEVQVFYRKYVGGRTAVVSQLYWKERGVPSNTLLNTPHWYQIDTAAPPTADRVRRALAHSQYHSGRIRSLPEPRQPRIRFGEAGPDVLHTASSLQDVFTKPAGLIEYLEA